MTRIRILDVTKTKQYLFTLSVLKGRLSTYNKNHKAKNYFKMTKMISLNIIGN